MYCIPTDLLPPEEEGRSESHSSIHEGPTTTTNLQPRSGTPGTAIASEEERPEDRPEVNDFSSSSAHVITPSGPSAGSPMRERGQQELKALRNPMKMTAVTSSSSCETWGQVNNWRPPTDRTVELRMGKGRLLSQERAQWCDGEGMLGNWADVNNRHSGNWQNDRRRSRSKSRGPRRWDGPRRRVEQQREDIRPREGLAWPSAADGRIYELAKPPSSSQGLVSSALSTEERRRRFEDLSMRKESKIKYVLATSPFVHMFFDDGAEAFLAPVQTARIDFLDTPMDQYESGLIEISSSCLYCVYCDQNKQCPPIDLKRFSVAHLTREHHKWRKAYYREQLDMCAEFNKRLDLIKSHQISLKLRPCNGEMIAQKYWCQLCERGLKGFVEIRDHLRDDFHTQRIGMYAFCEQRGLTLPPRRLGTEASSKSHFVEVPNVQRLTRDDMERNGIVITDGDNYPEEPSGWLYCSYCRKKFADPQRLEEHCKSWRHVLACTPKSS